MSNKEHKVGEYIPMPKHWGGVDFDIKTMPPKRKPLSWEKVLEIGLACANDHSRLPYEVKIARAVEAAHGIKD